MSEKEKKREGLDRYIFMALFILALAVAIVYNLARLQLIEGSAKREESVRRMASTGTIYAQRGDIYDRNGVPLAGSRMGYGVQYVDVSMTNAEKNHLLNEMLKVLKKDGKTVKTRLANFISLDPVRFVTEKPADFIKTFVMVKEDAQYIITADQALKYLREKVFQIDSSYSEQEALELLQVRYEILMSQPSVKQPLLLADDVSVEVMLELEERGSELRGVTTFVKPYREYYENAPYLAHVLGYVSNISSEELKVKNEELAKDKNNVLYLANDIIGKIGIESAAEELLRGIPGKTFKEVDETGKTTQAYVEQEPRPGQDLYLTIDMELQKVAVNALENGIKDIRDRAATEKIGANGRKNFGDANAGALVALSVKTGEVLAMASSPSFDPNIFINNDIEAINALFADENSPSLNRATNSAYPPGSTYKPLVAMAALESGVITANQKINAPYKETIGDYPFTNLEGNQGYINLERALETSSNMYFYKVGVMTGIDKIAEWARIFGFGKPTSIEIGESVGSLASKEYKLKYYNEDWYPANTAMASIGQLYNSFTPIQIANYISAIANNGRQYTPHLIQMAVSGNGEITYEAPGTYTDIPASQASFAAVKKGMAAVTNKTDGTASKVFEDFSKNNITVAGKTGTSETGREATTSSHGLFVCYAPMDDPEIAVVVVVEHGVWGSYTAPIAREFLLEYFRLNEKNSQVDKDTVEAVEIIW